MIDTFCCRLYCAATVATAPPSGGALFFTHWQQPPTVAQNARLQAILQAEYCPEQTEQAIATAGLVVLPRLGTVSPWSSKATAIAWRCGLTTLIRLEQGWWYAKGDAALAAAACDPMRQQILRAAECQQWRQLFSAAASSVSDETLVLTAESLASENARRGLALTVAERDYLLTVYQGLRRASSVAELMMFAQANSEHCRHKIFNAQLHGVAGRDDVAESLMALIRRTHQAHPRGVITAFNDNAAVIASGAGGWFAPDAEQIYRHQTVREGLYIVAKAETHNHPTAISPYPGAATGSGGEIRDEAAAGRGASARAGFSGYMVSALDNPAYPPPSHIASARQIISEAPLGAAAYNNEFGRAALAGFFRSYEQAVGTRYYGFHKPLMLAGGLGDMLPSSAGKRALPVGALIIQLGGEGFRIGIGGGAASSNSGGQDAVLDFASVQRDNAEMQRRAQQVIDNLRARSDNPILSLHDVGAGGLANAVSELVHDSARGAHIQLDAVPVGERGMSAAEVWCNESQERYVLALMPESLTLFSAVCRRENCPFAVIGEVRAAPVMVAEYQGKTVVNLPLDNLLGDINRLSLVVHTLPPPAAADRGLTLAAADLTSAAYTVLRHPSVACKRFLITIGDRTVGGLTAREQMVGPWQTPVADCAAFCHDFSGVAGAAFALGERASAAALNPCAAVRLAISEALLNLCAADVERSAIKLSLNWMANCADESRHSELAAAVQAAADFCVALGVGVIVGKDSLFMRMASPAAESGEERLVESPTFAAAFAFAPLADVRRVVTPQLSRQTGTVLMHLTFAAAADAPSVQPLPPLGGSIAAQTGVFKAANSQLPQQVADIEAAALLAGCRVLAECHRRDLLLAYHDCSDGGLWAALCEMAFAANCGLDIYADTFAAAAPETDGGGKDGWVVKTAAALFSEAPAVVIEVAAKQAAEVMQIVAEQTVPTGVVRLQTVARPQYNDKTLRVYGGGDLLLKESLADLRRAWESFGVTIAAQRDNPLCINAEAARDMDNDRGLFAQLPPSLPLPLTPVDAAPAGGTGTSGKSGKADNRPRVAILREVGTNGQREMAAAFTSAGFAAVDVTMQDLLDKRYHLDEQFTGIALCGGFSYGDVLGAGRGFALGILNNPYLSDQFAAFFARRNTFALGVCNGCQTLAHLQQLMPAADQWQLPTFHRNVSGRFEARLAMVEILPSPSLFFDNMAGLMFPIVVSHGEGRSVFKPLSSSHTNAAGQKSAAATIMRYVDNHGAVTEAYPYNPNGSAHGATGFCSPDGRITLMMPHPERLYRQVQMSWQPSLTQPLFAGYTPWKLLFDNARRFVG